MKPDISVYSVRSKLASYGTIEKFETDDAVYFREYDSDQTTLFYLGVHHSYNPDDPMFMEIKSKFDAFLTITEGRDRCVVIEGGLRDMASDRNASILNQGGEGGYLTYLAGIADIKTVCYEPDQKNVIADASNIYGQDMVFYSLMCDRTYQYSQEADKPDFSSYIQYFINEFNTLMTETYSIAIFSEIHQRISGKQLDHEDSDIFYRLSDPTNVSNPILEVSSYIAEYRDAYIAKEIIKNHLDGISQFVLYGKTHALIQEPAILHFLLNKTYF